MQTELKQPWIAVVSVPRPSQPATVPQKYHGDGRDILLQGFHWDSHHGAHEPGHHTRKSWYRILSDNAAAIKGAGFSWVWFPPASDALDCHGYIPRRWNVLDTRYGSEHELRGAIQALHPVKAMADVVLNHRVGVATGGADFADPAFPDNRAAVARDDDSGVGTGRPDTGEHSPCGRDLDHTNPDVRHAVKHYLRRLRHVGFAGWRYDMAKGYHGRFVGEYNQATAPEFSVGEFYDGDRQKVTHWIDSTGGNSTAFDFSTRYLLYDACMNDDYGRLRSMNGGRVVPAGLIGFWPSRSVTFLDNHDTEYRREEDHRRLNDPTYHFPGKQAETGYAYLLTHPGVPCVFWSHFFDWGPTLRHKIQQLMKVRQYSGVHATSWVDIKEARKGLYAAIIEGKLAVKLGSRDWCPGGGWRLAVDGEKFAVWARN